MVGSALVGRTYAPYSATVEAGRLRLFAKAIGETRPEYVDEDAARAAGHPGLPAPPTFVACLAMEVPDPFAWLREAEVDVARMLHAAQGFRYFAPVHAGDRLTFAARIDRVTAKKGGTLTFIVRATEVTNQHGARVAQVRTTVVVREA